VPEPASPDHEGLEFGEYYYAHDCGIPYERNEHWNRFFGQIADRIVASLHPTNMLDAGCATGMLVEAMRARGVDADGIDISEWAIENMPPEVRKHCRQGSLADPIDGHYDLVTCVEVVEHIPQPDDARAIEHLCSVTDRVLISSSPHDYSEPTHVTVRPPEDWAALFAGQGFVRDLEFDATFLTPWAVLYKRSDAPLAEVVRQYERKLTRTQDEAAQLRSRALHMQDQLEKDYSAASVAELRQELLATREELVTLTREVGTARGRIRELEDTQEIYRGAVDELTGFKRSRIWSSFTLYASVRRKFAPVVDRLLGR
jgi:Methyltransferase domain